MTHSQFLVLNVLKTDWYYTTKGIMHITKLNKLQARRAIRGLVRLGYAEHVTGIFDDDGQLAGSGYAVTEAGRIERDQRD